MDFWNECPDDLLISIFEHLDLQTRLKAAQVCRNWYRLSNDPRTKMDVASISFRRRPCSEADIRFLKMLLENHLGKIGELRLFDQNWVNLPWISTVINESRVRIDKLNLVSSSDNFLLSNCINSILPSSIRHLELNAKNGQQQILITNWTQFSGLQRLSLGNVSITNPSSTILLPSLKYLDLSFDRRDDFNDARRLNETLAFLPSLQELRLDNMAFDDKTFRNFLLTINNEVPNLSKLRFEDVNFNLSTGEISEFVRSFNFPVLKEIEFSYCQGEWIDIAQLFLPISSLDTMIISTCRMVFMEDIYRLMPLIKEKKVELILKLNLCSSTEIFRLESLVLPTELCDVLTTVTINTNPGIGLRIPNPLPPPTTRYLCRLFGCGSFEKLTTIDLFQCHGLKDGISKLIAQSCPVLKIFKVWNDEVAENGFNWFLIFWHERRSQRLSIRLPESFRMDGLFGTSVTDGRGILEDGKRWMTLQKAFLMNDQKKGTRLIIWDQGNTDEGIDQKFLEISNYDPYKVRENVTI